MLVEHHDAEQHRDQRVDVRDDARPARSASVIEPKKYDEPSAVQTTPSTAMAHSADGGIALWRAREHAGSSATVDRARLAATDPAGPHRPGRRLTMMGAAA